MLGPKDRTIAPGPARAPQRAARASRMVTHAAAGAGKDPRIWLGKGPKHPPT